MTTPVAGAAAVEAFEAERSRLRGVAYRIVGTLTDADDVVQEAWLRWQGVDAASVRSPAAWLTTATTRLALDRLRALRRRRESYVGSWLPEPVVAEPGPAEHAELAESLRLGLLVVLDRLQPEERAVFVLAEALGLPYAEIGEIVGRSAGACRQMASRARRRVRDEGPPPLEPAAAPVVEDLVVALAGGDVAGVIERLGPGVVCTSDGGAARRAARRPVVGPERVARLLVNLANRAGPAASARPGSVGGDPAFIVSLDGTLDMVMVFELHGPLVGAIRIVRNPDKLGAVGHPIDLL